ncbi:hypothetical protein A2U01_0032808, partial [Trifolium medium]|nr:hypothetical protein [Trifolium medium]
VRMFSHVYNVVKPKLKLSLIHDADVSGNFMLVYGKNPSPWRQFKGVFLTQPSDQFDDFHFV